MTVQDVARRLPDIPVVRDRSRSLPCWPPSSARNGSTATTPSAPPGDRRRNWRRCATALEATYAIVFSPAGAWVRVFAHESPMSPWGLEPPRPWPGVLDTVPTAFQACVQEPAFTLDGVAMVSACLWRQTTDDRWHTGAIDFPAGQEDPDGSEWLLELLLDHSPEAYRWFAEDYYQPKSVNLAAVREIYALRPLTQPAGHHPQRRAVPGGSGPRHR